MFPYSPMNRDKEFLSFSSSTAGDAWAAASLIEKLQAENRVLQLQLLEKKINESFPYNEEQDERKGSGAEDNQENIPELDLDSLSATQLQVEVLRRQLRRERRYRRYLQKNLTQEVQLMRVWIDHNRVRHREQLRRLHVKMAAASPTSSSENHRGNLSIPGYSGPSTPVNTSIASPMIFKRKEGKERYERTSKNREDGSHSVGITSSVATTADSRTEVAEKPFHHHSLKATESIQQPAAAEVLQTKVVDPHPQQHQNCSPDRETDDVSSGEAKSNQHMDPCGGQPSKSTQEQENDFNRNSTSGLGSSTDHLGSAGHASISPHSVEDHENSFPDRRTYYYKYSAPVHSKSEEETKSIIKEAVSRSETRRKQREALRSIGVITGLEGSHADPPLRTRRSPQSTVKFSDGTQLTVEHQTDSPIRLRGGVGSRGGDWQSGEVGLLPPLTLTSGGHLSAPYSHSKFVNPNQIGEEIREDKKSKAWYVRHALRLAFLKAVRSDDGEEGNSNSKGSASRRGSIPTPLLRGASHVRLSGVKSVKNSPLSPLRSAMNNSSSVPNTQSGAASEDAVSASTITSALMGVNSASMQRAIQEVTHYYFYLSNNSPVLCMKPRVGCIRLEDENDDPDLLQALDASVKVPTSGENSFEGGDKRRSGLGRPGVPLSSSTSVGGGGGGGKQTSPIPLHQRSFSAASQGSSTANNPTTPSTSESLRDDDLRISFHAPVIFNQIREFLGLCASTFREAVDCSIWRESLSPGKSGTSLIYFGDYVMKTLPDSDYNMLTTQYLPAYAKYCEQYPDSLLTRFYAIVSVKWLKSGLTKCYVLMQNVFTTRQYINRIYDVKGSTVGRSAIQPGKEPPRTAFGALLLKDNDLPDQLLRIRPAHRRALLSQLKLDLQFLQRLSIVDYSMMIGVRSRVLASHDHHSAGGGGNSSNTYAPSRRNSHALEGDDKSSRTVPFAEQDSLLHSGVQQLSSDESGGMRSEEMDVEVTCLRSCDGGLQSLPIQQEDNTTMREEVYYLGVIDVLQEYNSTKKFENFAKGLYSDRTQISVIPPLEYADRLYKVIERISFSH